MAESAFCNTHFKTLLASTCYSVQFQSHFCIFRCLLQQHPTLSTKRAVSQTPPNTITLGVRVSTCVFGGDTSIQYITPPNLPICPLPLISSISTHYHLTSCSLLIDRYFFIFSNQNIRYERKGFGSYFVHCSIPRTHSQSSIYSC